MFHVSACRFPEGLYANNKHSAVQSDKKFTVKVDIPGVNKEDISVRSPLTRIRPPASSSQTTR